MKTYIVTFRLHKQYAGHGLASTKQVEITSIQEPEKAMAQVDKSNIDKKYKAAAIELIKDDGPDKTAEKPADTDGPPRTKHVMPESIGKKWPRDQKGDNGGNNKTK